MAIRSTCRIPKHWPSVSGHKPRPVGGPWPTPGAGPGGNRETHVTSVKWGDPCEWVDVCVAPLLFRRVGTRGAIRQRADHRLVEPLHRNPGPGSRRPYRQVLYVAHLRLSRGYHARWQAVTWDGDRGQVGDDP